MKTTVQLQDPFSYSTIPLIVMGVLLLSYVIFRLVVWILKWRKQRQEKKEMQPVKRVIDLPALKSEYLAKVYELEQLYRNGEVDNREAYTRISSIFRNFVYDATGVEAPKYTLRDMEGLNMPVLYQLVNHYYAPEFSVSSSGNISESMEMTKRAIELWN